MEEPLLLCEVAGCSVVEDGFPDPTCDLRDGRVFVRKLQLKINATSAEHKLGGAHCRVYHTEPEDAVVFVHRYGGVTARCRAERHTTPASRAQLRDLSMLR